RSAFFKIFEENPDIEGIIHFAAYKSVPESVLKPLEYYHNNLESMENVLEACKTFKINNLIFSSSCSVYGEVATLPVDEHTPIGDAFCPYAHTKQINEKMIHFFLNVNPQIKGLLLRYFNPVGNDMSGLNGELSPDIPNNLMPILTQVGIGKMPTFTVFGTDYATRDGSCIRDYVHVLDIANAHIKALEYLMSENNTGNFDIFNLGSGTGISVLEMVHAFEKVTGIKLNYTIGDRRPGDIPAIYSNSTRAEKLLGWKCQYTLEDMISSAWKWELWLDENK
ncbi:MAG: UDP-glucose 4-epimerase GalE, partial [Bacteroidales bacterium]|nr:UDP-glucose 4-epimerase GalE [Bacteroidales bacterium]